jgi:hypothetical protein
MVDDASELEADLGDLAPLVKEELARGWHYKMVTAEMRQQRIKAASDRLAAARRTVDGIGQHTMSIDFDSYMYWNRALPGCWTDKSFREEFAAANPHTRVISTSTTTVVNPGFAKNEN